MQWEFVHYSVLGAISLFLTDLLPTMPPTWVGLAGLKAGLEWPWQGLPKNRFLLFPGAEEIVLSDFFDLTRHFWRFSGYFGLRSHPENGGLHMSDYTSFQKQRTCEIKHHLN